MFRKDIPIIPRYGSELNSYTLLVLHFMAFFINIIIIGMTMKIASDFLSLAQTAPRAIVGLIVFSFIGFLCLLMAFYIYMNRIRKALIFLAAIDIILCIANIALVCSLSSIYLSNDCAPFVEAANLTSELEKIKDSEHGCLFGNVVTILGIILTTDYGIAACMLGLIYYAHKHRTDIPGGGGNSGKTEEIITPRHTGGQFRLQNPPVRGAEPKETYEDDS